MQAGESLLKKCGSRTSGSHSVLCRHLLFGCRGFLGRCLPRWFVGSWLCFLGRRFLRWWRNEGGFRLGENSNFGYNILRMMAQHPFKSSAWKTRDYKAAERAWGNTPGWFYGSPEEILLDLDHNSSKPIAVLIGAHTFSAAEDFVAAFHGMHRGILVGQRTAGSTGQPMIFSLPGGGTARVCTKDDTAPDNTSFEGIGFIPDFAAELSVQDIRTGKTQC